MISHVKHPGESFTWIDVIDPSPEEMNELAVNYNLHPSAVQDCLQTEHLPKYESFDETSFIITRYFDVYASKNSDDINEISRKLSLFFNKKFIITIHRQDFEPYERVKDTFRGHESIGDVLYRIIKCTLSTYEGPVDRLDLDIDYYESRLFLKAKIPDLLKSLYLIKRRIYVIRKIVNITEGVIEKIGLNQKKTPYYEDLRDYYVKLDTLIEEVHDSIQSLLAIYISLSSQRTNEVMRTLTVFTAFFLPLTFIVGIYGMNFHYMPELVEPLGYPAIMGIMFILTLLIFIWFKRKGWM